MTALSESQTWDATMDALEENWRLQLADSQYEYRNEHQMLYGTGAAAPGEESSHV